MSFAVPMWRRWQVKCKSMEHWWKVSDKGEVPGENHSICDFMKQLCVVTETLYEGWIA